MAPEFGGPIPAVDRPLSPGWNLVSWPGEEVGFISGAAGLFGVAPAVSRWETEHGSCDVFHAAAPAAFNSLRTLHAFDGLWVYVTTDEPTVWEQPGLAAATP